MTRLIVLDTETTGLAYSQGHRIIEIGAVEIVKNKLSQSNYQQYINPKKAVGASFRVHKISDDFLKDQPIFETIYQDFLTFIKGATLIIHNAAFDLGFLNQELSLVGYQEKLEDTHTIIDTIMLAKKQLGGSRHSLDALCRRFKIDSSHRTAHGALLDAQLLARVYLAMTGRQKELFNNLDNQPIKKTITLSEKTTIKQAKTTVIKANSDELSAHNNYFA